MRIQREMDVDLASNARRIRIQCEMGRSGVTEIWELDGKRVGRNPYRDGGAWREMGWGTVSARAPTGMVELDEKRNGR